MEFKLPFDESVIDEMSGRTMVLAENHRNESLFVPVKELKVIGGGDCEKPWRMEVVGGYLRLLRDGVLFCEFCGLESRGGAPYAVGHRADAEHKHGFGRLVMYEKKRLSPGDCGVCISSHVDYEKSTMEPILKSLKKTGFDMSKVVVVVDGDKRWEDWSDERDDEVTLTRANSKAVGFAGLLGATEGPLYWLLVHDTCEFERGFVDKLAAIDVGLGQDMALLYPPEERNEMGLYSSKFLASSGVDIHVTKPNDIFASFLRNSKSMTVVPGKRSFLGESDVYGSGKPRKVVRVESVGIKKFSGKRARGGRP